MFGRRSVYRGCDDDTEIMSYLELFFNSLETISSVIGIERMIFHLLFHQ